MSNIQATGYVAMTFNFIVVLCWLIVIFRSQGFSNSFTAPPKPGAIFSFILPKRVIENKNFRKTVLTGGLVFKFSMALLDSFFGSTRE